MHNSGRNRSRRHSRRRPSPASQGRTGAYLSFDYSGSSNTISPLNGAPASSLTFAFWSSVRTARIFLRVSSRSFASFSVLAFASLALIQVRQRLAGLALEVLELLDLLVGQLELLGHLRLRQVREGGELHRDLVEALALLRVEGIGQELLVLPSRASRTPPCARPRPASPLSRPPRTALFVNSMIFLTASAASSSSFWTDFCRSRSSLTVVPSGTTGSVRPGRRPEDGQDEQDHGPFHESAHRQPPLMDGPGPERPGPHRFNRRGRLACGRGVPRRNSPTDVSA